MPFRNLPPGVQLDARDSTRLTELLTEWQLLADLSFADLVLWFPIRPEISQEASGHIAIAQIRPMTSATVFTQDVIGTKISTGDRPNIDQALMTGSIIRDSETVQLGDFTVREETIPVRFESRIIAVISRHRNVETMRTPSKLELNYREIANHIYRMISEGNFPIQDSVYQSETAPRVGDGLVRLNLDGEVIFASPNARSAFARLGWTREMAGHHFGEILEELSIPIRGREPRDENWRVKMSGKMLRRDEFENANGIIDLLAMPLTEGDFRIGAVVLAHNVTELRRRDRALVSKDATIREIHHRVKNNLQAVSALLRIQSRRTEEDSARAAIEEAIRRIGSIAHVHETLSASSGDSVLFDEVIMKIMNSSVELSTRPNEIQIEKSGEFGSVPSLYATPLALVLTELIQNALEHGLGESGNLIRLEVFRSDGNFAVSVIDDGVGLRDDFSIEESASLGLDIVKTLTENELNGTLRFQRRDRGTEVKIDFSIH